MKKIDLLIALFLVPLLFIGTMAHAQDMIIKNDKTQIKAKVVEITDQQIKYYKFEALDGPIYNINKTDVFMIVYKNGTTETYTAAPVQQQAAPQQYTQQRPVAATPSRPSPAPENTTVPSDQKRPFTWGADVEAILPLGTFGDAVSFGLAVGPKVLYNIPNTDSYVTATAQGTYYLAKGYDDNGNKVKYIGLPVKLGYLQVFSDKYFVEPQAGLFALSATFDGLSSTSTNFMAGGQVGMYFDKPGYKGSSRVALGYYYVSGSDGGSLSFVGLSLFLSY